MDENSAHTALSSAKSALADLGLEINQGKTPLTPLSQASFLGFGFMKERGIWVRDLPQATRDACIQHLRRMEDSARAPSELSTFAAQWAAYFLPHADDRKRHRPFLEELVRSFNLATPADNRPRNTPPPGYSDEGRRHEA